MALPLFAVGFTAVVGQVLLMRELVAAFYGNELLFGLILAAWLAWGAVGSAAAARWRRGVGRTVGPGLALAALLLPAQLGLVRGVRDLLGVPPGAFVELAPTVLAVILIPAPLCALLGGLFSLAARSLPGPAAGARAYLWESAGSVTGGILFSFVFIHWLDPFQIALLVGSLDLALAMHLRLSASPRPRIPGFPYLRVLLLCAPAFLLPVSLALGRALHTATLAWQWSDLAFATDSPYGRLTILARGEQRAFFENGALSFETQSTFPEEVVHFPLLAHPAPRSVLLVGGGVGGDLREALRHPVEEVVYVELDPAVIEAARTHLPPQESAVLDDPRARLVLTDGRRYVQTAGRTFDVVILDLPEPSTGALNRFYTVEFFAEVRAVLTPGGVFSLGLPSAENYWSPELARRNGSVYWSLREVFPEVLVLPGEHTFFLASDRPLPTDPAVLTGRMAERGIEARWVTPAYVEYVLTTDRFSQVQAELLEMADVRRNRDRWPVCYYYDLALWLSRFYPGLRPLFEQARPVSLIWTAMGLAVLAGLARWRKRAIPFAVAVVGLTEMGLEMVVLLSFQVAHGTLYGRVSLVVTGFMAGLAGGAAVGRRLAGRARPVLLGVLGGLACLAVGMALLPLALPEAAYLLLALTAGGLGGMAFPLAVALAGGEEGQTAGLLYAADLAGGCLGALATATLAIPLLGLGQTAFTLALAGLAGIMAVW